MFAGTLCLGRRARHELKSWSRWGTGILATPLPFACCSGPAYDRGSTTPLSQMPRIDPPQSAAAGNRGSRLTAELPMRNMRRSTLSDCATRELGRDDQVAALALSELVSVVSALAVADEVWVEADVDEAEDDVDPAEASSSSPPSW